MILYLYFNKKVRLFPVLKLNQIDHDLVKTIGESIDSLLRFEQQRITIIKNIYGIKLNNLRVSYKKYRSRNKK